MEQDPMLPRILIVEDEILIAWSLASTLHHLGFEIRVVDSGEQAISMLSSTPIDLVIADIELQSIDGYEVAAVAKGHHPSIPVIMISALRDSSENRPPNKSCVDSFIEKPFDLHEVSKQVEQLLRRNHSVPDDSNHEVR